MELLIYLALIFLGFSLGQAYTTLKLTRLLKKVAEEEGIDLEKEIEATKKKQEQVHQIYNLEVEKINDMLYLFDRNNKDFVCQGNSLEELAKLAKEYKNIVVATVVHGDKVFMFVNGASKEYKV